jgi:hypothetical protein
VVWFESFAMVSCYLLLAQAEEPSRIVVKDVALLAIRKKRGRLDALDGDLERRRPYHLVGTEQHPISESGLNDRSHIPVELRARQTPADHTDAHESD